MHPFTGLPAIFSKVFKKKCNHRRKYGYEYEYIQRERRQEAF